MVEQKFKITPQGLKYYSDLDSRQWFGDLPDDAPDEALVPDNFQAWVDYVILDDLRFQDLKNLGGLGESSLYTPEEVERNPDIYGPVPFRSSLRRMLEAGYIEIEDDFSYDQPDTVEQGLEQRLRRMKSRYSGERGLSGGGSEVGS